MESPDSSSVDLQDKNGLNIPAFWVGKDMEAVNKATLGGKCWDSLTWVCPCSLLVKLKIALKQEYAKPLMFCLGSSERLCFVPY